MRSFLQRHRRLAAESAWVFGGQAAAAIATLVGLRLITELVPPAVYGVVALALGVVALAHGLAAGPLMQAVLRYYPDLVQEGREDPLRHAAIRALRKPLLLSLGGLAVLGAGWSLYQPHDAWLAVLSVALFLAEVARSVEITFLNAARHQRAMAVAITADAWLRPLAAAVLLWAFGVSSWAVMAGYLAGCLLTLAGIRFAGPASAQDNTRPERVPAGSDIPRRLWAYALPLTALPVIAWLSGQADRYIVGGLAGVATAGLYAALYGLASKPFLMFSAGVELALRQPYYATASAEDRAAERRALALWLAAVTAVALPLLLLFVLFHGEIAALLLAAEYRTHSVLMAWVAAGYVLLSIAQVLERVCYAHHDTRGVLWVEASGAALSMIVAAPLVFAYGIEGAAWAAPVYFGAQLLIAAARARRAWRRAMQSPALAAVPIVTPSAQ